MNMACISVTLHELQLTLISSLKVSGYFIVSHLFEILTTQKFCEMRAKT